MTGELAGGGAGRRGRGSSVDRQGEDVGSEDGRGGSLVPTSETHVEKKDPHTAA